MAVSEDSSALTMTSEDGVKYGFAVTTLVVACGGLFQARGFALRPTLAATANCFTSGVIIATALVHLLAEAASGDDEFPWACTLAGVGYGAMISIEQYGHDAMKKRRPCQAGERDPLTNGRTHHHHHVDGGVVATVALAIHSVGDGAAIALQEHRSKVTAIGGAILVHKFFAASALGTILARDTKRHSVLAALFVLATPLTIVIVVLTGRALSDSAVDHASALCAGSLLYVGIHEILLDTLDDDHLPLHAKLGLFWTGFALMSVLAIWV